MSLIAVILYFYLVFHRQLRAQAAAGREAGISVMKPEEAITSKKGLCYKLHYFSVCGCAAGHPMPRQALRFLLSAS